MFFSLCTQALLLLRTSWKHLQRHSLEEQYKDQCIYKAFLSLCVQHKHCHFCPWGYSTDESTKHYALKIPKAFFPRVQKVLWRHKESTSSKWLCKKGKRTFMTTFHKKLHKCQIIILSSQLYEQLITFQYILLLHKQ